MTRAEGLSRSKNPEVKPLPGSYAAKAVEAMRRATEQATKGPREMRAGRYAPTPKKAAE